MKKPPAGILILSSAIIFGNMLSVFVLAQPGLIQRFPQTIKDIFYSLAPFTMICLNYSDKNTYEGAIYWQIAGILVSIFFSLLGIMLLRLNEIARKIFVIFQAVLLFIGLVMVLFGLLWYGELRHQGMSMLSFIATQLLPSVWRGCFFPTVFVVYLTRQKVKERFN